MATISSYSSIAEIKTFIDRGLSYEEISSELQFRYPAAGGFSERSVRRFCKENQINKNCTLSQKEKEELIRTSISQVSFRLRFLFSTTPVI